MAREDGPTHLLAFAGDGALVAAASLDSCTEDGIDADAALLGHLLSLWARDKIDSFSEITVFEAHVLDDPEPGGLPQSWVDEARARGSDWLNILGGGDEWTLPTVVLDIPDRDRDSVYAAMGRPRSTLDLVAALADPVRVLVARLAHARFPARVGPDAVAIELPDHGFHVSVSLPGMAVTEGGTAVASASGPEEAVRAVEAAWQRFVAALPRTGC